MNIKKRQITTYYFDCVFDGFCVDVETDIDDKEKLNFYIYHKECSIKAHMFGVFRKTLIKENLSIEDIISGNIEQSIELYKKHYIKD